MSDFWGKSIKIVGLPGLVLYLFYFLIDKVFDDKLTKMLEIDRFFVLILIMLALLFVFFIYSTFRTTIPRSNKATDDSQQKNTPDEMVKSNLPSSPATAVKIQTVEYRDNTKHDGDNNFS
ncbi:hypothetical protein M0J40_RS16870 [Providencia rettgeri]|nr:hypothetical protein [Providencia rettgeri]ELR5126935.1 hypothetical protein [Providencia rettgeri]ELR5246024.1 hypothetical protein [Providencia rettgeri]ELS4585126.1 hypothetical protein [Providencia rettgeri]